MKNHLLLCLSSLSLLMACSGQEQSNDKKVRTVIVTQPKQPAQQSSRTFGGRIAESRSLAVGFKTAGQIAKIAVSEGDYVREGQLLASLDQKDYRLGVEAVQIQYNQLKDETERLRKLYEGHSISANDYEKAKSGLEQLGVQLQANKNKLDYTMLYAPSNGYISKVNFEVSEMVDAGTQVFTLLDTRGLEVEIDVPADVYLAKEKIVSISARTPFDGDKQQHPMSIISTTPKSDANQLYHLRLSFADKADSRLTAGMNIEVMLTMTEDVDEQNLSLPLHSIAKAENGDAYVLEVTADSTVHRQKVEILRVDENGEAVISSALHGDEQIVKAGVTHLCEGDKVRIVEGKKW